MLLDMKGTFGMTPPENVFKLPQRLAFSGSAQEAGWLFSSRAWPAATALD